jgi:hypothetical protein
MTGEDEGALERIVIDVLASRYFLQYVEDVASLKSLLKVLRGRRKDAFREVSTQYLKIVKLHKFGRWLRVNGTVRWFTLMEMSRTKCAEVQSVSSRLNILI